MDNNYLSRYGCKSELRPNSHTKEEIEHEQKFADMRGFVNTIQEGSDSDKIKAIDSLSEQLKTDITIKEDLVFFTSMVEAFRQIYLNSENDALKDKVIQIAVQMGIERQIQVIVPGSSLLNQISAIVIRNTRVIQIPYGARSIQSHGMVVPLNPEITTANKIVRCEMKFLGRGNTHRYGIVGPITQRMAHINYCPGSDRDSVGAEKTGEIIRRKEWVQGNDQFGEEDIVGLEDFALLCQGCSVEALLHWNTRKDSLLRLFKSNIERILCCIVRGIRNTKSRNWTYG
ncbi:MAG: hypothetical protein EZS28_016946 [Streblomastix strix]|uniref:Uncharacterized protein n=1 Tax=Streblomastix strix TaxID=222440 RepID=A0A5J4VY19_9EUKA|nr:MAG: hypothetical protein EZS28_016946 [Streblomastix strix]